MRQCLISPDGGYYTSQTEGRDQFGQKGDFITSPEISQVFGELLGIWLVAEWMAQGRRSSGVELIEAGPGRGTLMADILRVWCGSHSGLTQSRTHTRTDGTKFQVSCRQHRMRLSCGGQPCPTRLAEATPLRECNNGGDRYWLPKHQHILGYPGDLV